MILLSLYLSIMLSSLFFVEGFRGGMKLWKPISKRISPSTIRFVSKSSSSPEDINYSKLSRLYITDALNENTLVRLQKGDTNYVVNVMRMKSGSSIRVFNPDHGEFLAEVQCEKRDASLKIKSQIRAVRTNEDSAFPGVLFFAPIKKTRLKTLFEKATELGIEHIIPVVTQNTQYPIEASSIESYRKICIQSAEQCERITLPTLHSQISLSDLLAGSENKVKDIHTSALLSLPLLVCAERISTDSVESSSSGSTTVSKSGLPLLSAVQTLLSTQPVQSQATDSTKSTQHAFNPSMPLFGVFVGPEGGFTEPELRSLSALQHAQLVSLGKNVLRAETASIAALSVIACAAESVAYEKQTRKEMLE